MGRRLRIFAAVMAGAIVASLLAPTVAKALPRPLPPSSGKTFYVATTGSDSAAGSLRHPWRTITHALRTLKPNQRVLVRSGRYAENVLVSRSGTVNGTITVRNFPGERPVLVPKPRSLRYPLEIWNVSYFRFRGFAVQNAVGSSMANVYVAGDSAHVEISHCVVRYSEQQGIFTDPTTRSVQLLANLIYDNGRVGEPDQNHGIYIEGVNHLVANNVIFGQTNGFGIQVYPRDDYVTVTDNTVVGNRLGGIVVGGNGSTTASHVVLADNVVAFNGGSGLYGYYGGGRTGLGNLAVRNLVWENAGGNLVNDPAPTAVLSFSRSIVAPPRFVDLAAHDFRPRAGSAALDRALAEYSSTWDFRGVHRPQGKGYDLGAFERRR